MADDVCEEHREQGKEAMYCPYCGAENKDTDKFCKQCGGMLGANQAVPTPEAQPRQESYQAQAGGAPTQQATMGNAWQGAPGGVPQPIPPVQTEGAFSAAWHDLTSTPGWFKKVILLTLLNCVPVLNLVVAGYAMNWGRDVVYGRRESMPEKFFANRTMGLGFAIWIITLLGTLFATACSVALGIVIPIVGAIAGAVLSVFANMFFYVSLIRMGVFGKFAAAFDYRECWHAYSKRLGALFCAVCLPEIIIYAIAFVIALILMTIWGIGGVAAFSDIANTYNQYGYYGYPSSANPIASISSAVVGGGFLLILLVLIIVFLFAFAGTCVSLLVYRALGHWTAQTAPQWTQEAIEAQRIYGVDFPSQDLKDTALRRL